MQNPIEHVAQQSRDLAQQCELIRTRMTGGDHPPTQHFGPSSYFSVDGLPFKNKLVDTELNSALDTTN
jgi:hypothetical protein